MTAASQDAVPDSAGRRWYSTDEIRSLYAAQADTMDRLAVVNRLVTGRYRRSLFGRAEGRVLDVACGMGLNLTYLPDEVDYTGVDLSPAMLEKADAKYDLLQRGDSLLEMDAQALGFRTESFDTVISSLSTCTFPDPIAALNEMNRVCRPGGRVLLLEHGRSDIGILARLQDWRAEAHYESEGCRWNQEPRALVAAADLSLESVTTGLGGIITAIEARPAADGTN